MFFVDVENPIFNYRFLLIFTLCHFIFILTWLLCYLIRWQNFNVKIYVLIQASQIWKWMNEWMKGGNFSINLFFIFQIDKQTNINIDVMMLFERLVKVSVWLFSLMKWKYKFFLSIMIVTSSAYGIWMSFQWYYVMVIINITLKLLQNIVLFNWISIDFPFQHVNSTIK